MGKKKHFLDRKFKHHKWFKEGVTVGCALDYFAKSEDFYLKQTSRRKQNFCYFAFCGRLGIAKGKEL